MGIFNKIKTAFGRINRDELEGLSSEDRIKLDRVIKERRFELIARKRLRSLENKFAPKEKKTTSEIFADIKQFREKNLKNRKERMARVEDRKKRFKAMEERRKSGRKIMPGSEKRKPFTPTRLGRL